MTQPYRPSNGTEGASFMAYFCDRCEREAAFRRDPDRHIGCGIAAAAMAFRRENPSYPKEWVADDDMGRNPRCTAFAPVVGEAGNG